MPPQIHVTDQIEVKRTLVAIFLRGGADGLTLVPPVEYDAYHRARPTLAIAKKEALPLDDRFALNPALGALLPLYSDGLLAIHHGVGSEDQTRSHFEAQDLMERGGDMGGGWLGRFLRFREGANSNALSAIAIGKAVPESLRGAPAAAAIESFEDFSLGQEADDYIARIESLYLAEEGDLRSAARDTLAAMRRIEEIRLADSRPRSGVQYPNDAFGEGLRRIAQLIQGRVGLEAACLDLEGWDSHFAQSAMLAPRLRSLSEGLAAFAADLGPDLETTSVVVMSEFGRRVHENTALGTDHGRGGVMMVLGGGVMGGRVHADLAGLDSESLEGPGDLPVTTHYSEVLGPVLLRHGVGDNLNRVFPSAPLGSMVG